MKNISKIIATAFGAGYVPKAPGTAGAFVGIIMLWFLDILYFQYFENVLYFWLLFIVLLFLFFIAGALATDQLEPEWGKDPSKVVMDEVVGVWISLFLIPLNWQNLFFGFILFRIFDIWKPLGIRKMEKIKGGWGVMLDDVLAGVYTNIILHVGLWVCERYF